MTSPQSGFSSTDSRSNLEMLVFIEGGKPENPEKDLRSKDENQQQTQPIYDTGNGNRARARFSSFKCSRFYKPQHALLKCFLVCEANLRNHLERDKLVICRDVKAQISPCCG